MGNWSTTASARRSTSSTGFSVQLNCAWGQIRATWCVSSVPTVCREGASMSQEDNPQSLAQQVDKVSPEAVALRAQPRPVKRLSRRALAALVGGLAVAVLGATIWSLRPLERREPHGPAELYNVDRISRSEGLESLPTDYSQLTPTTLAHPPELGPSLPGDLGPAILKFQRPAVPIYTPAGQDPAEAERLARLKEAEEAAG